MSELRIILKSKPEEKKEIFVIIGEKLSQSRKSSRKKLEGIAKKLNLSVEMLNNIEAGDVSKFPQTIHITGFLRAFAEKVDCDISLELEQLTLQEGFKTKKTSVLKLSNKFPFFLMIFFLIFFISLIFILSTPETKKEVSDIKTLENKKFHHLQKSLNTIEFENDEDINISFKQPLKKDYFEILFLEETWIEILDENKSLLKNGLFKIGESLMFEFNKEDSDFFIKSGNLGGFQIFYKEEFFAPFGLSGQVSKGFFFKEKINTVKNVRILKNEY
jgi:cytoskeletal protein RodZ